MAGQALTSPVNHTNSAPWQNKALSVATQVGHGFAVANGIREALPVIQNVARAASGYLTALMAAGAPFGF